ncbi:MAG: restriction endonuclease subunit S [Acidobacteria bacterium]|nr:restriction endonuclease subunit S [Acidobacteriota bacterium]
MGELFAHEFIGAQEMSRLAMTSAELEKSGLLDGDLLFGRRSLVETGAGKCSLVDQISEPTTFESSIIRVRLDPEEAEPRFYYYWFRAPAGRGSIRAIVSGTNVKGIRSSDLKNVQVPVIEKEAQCRIVGLLRAYDDLIENNRRRIHLLEQSARLLYREWFVHLRFPGHEHVRVVDGVPEGWERKTMADVAETVGGGTPSTSVASYWDDGTVTWFTPSDLTGNDCLALLDSEKKITEEGLKHSSAKMLPPETILMSSRASIGFFGMHDKPACTNQGFISLIPRDERFRYFLLYHLMHRKEEIVSHAGGTTYKEINKSTFRALPIVLPGVTIAAEFAEFAGDVMQQVRVLKRQSAKLCEARDLLLPRLMNGEITV